MFSQVEKLTYVRVLLSIATTCNWKMAQLDINNTFLNGDLFEEIYMDLPLGYPSEAENILCKLHKSLYGLTRASRWWYHKFLTTIIQYGFKQSSEDPSLFTKGSGNSMVVFLVYVDDIVLSSPNSNLIQETRVLLQSMFKLKLL